MTRLGIIGGIGPETSCMFCLNVNNKVIEKTNVQPSIIMENIPMPESTLNKLAHGEKPQLVLELLSKSVSTLNSINSDVIAIPCNTVHVFIDQLRAISNVPIVSIIEESAKECEKRDFKRVGLISSTTSVKEGLHSKELEKRNISCIFPTESQQDEISKIIVKIIRNVVKENDVRFIRSIISDLKDKGADSIMLACTDIRTIISEKDTPLPIVETTTALENAMVKLLVK
jgi:aspartate racemase